MRGSSILWNEIRYLIILDKIICYILYKIICYSVNEQNCVKHYFEASRCTDFSVNSRITEILRGTNLRH